MQPHHVLVLACAVHSHLRQRGLAQVVVGLQTRGASEGGQNARARSPLSSSTEIHHDRRDEGSHKDREDPLEVDELEHAQLQRLRVPHRDDV